MTRRGTPPWDVTAVSEPRVLIGLPIAHWLRSSARLSGRLALASSPPWLRSHVVCRRQVRFDQPASGISGASLVPRRQAVGHLMLEPDLRWLSGSGAVGEDPAGERRRHGNPPRRCVTPVRWVREVVSSGRIIPKPEKRTHGHESGRGQIDVHFLARDGIRVPQAWGRFLGCHRSRSPRQLRRRIGRRSRP